MHGARHDMNDFLDRISKLSPRRLALLALEQHEQAETAARRAAAPIAVIGIGCRFPGGSGNPAAFWQLLQAGGDAVVDVPHDRWDIDALFDPDPDAPSRMAVRKGGFLTDVSGFDSAFFGISPREALSMDPQQRLLLEVSWEALEHAAIAPESLSGSATGVFVGICNSDHFQRLLARGTDSIDGYLASGNAHSVAAGRIAYSLGLQGPALSIDTSCSSSLVALHVACRSVRSGESRLAIAAGVNVMCSPETTIALSKAHMLAPDGRCKTFDASADGFSRGEGCGVLILKRLEDALEDGDRVLALIRGTAVNQDGRSGGLTVPNGPAQEAVIRLALADARAQADQIDYVEAHGTGTALGDPIEVRALAGALGAGRTAADPLLIGSVKTNLGHLEAAAGIAGVIKVVLALQHERVPPHLHFHAPSPHIAWADYPLKVEPLGSAWPRGHRRRLAGVSSFGFSGTNAHLIIEEAPLAPAVAVAAERGLHCLPVSARTEAALARLAGAYAERFADPKENSLIDLVHTAGSGRSHLGERAAIVAGSNSEMSEALRALSLGRTHPALHRGSIAPGHSSEIVLLFTGQGSQYPGMSQQLYAGAPVFRDVIDRCEALLGRDQQGCTLKSVLWTLGGDQAPIHQTAWTQPALFAVEYGLAQLWRSWGIEPAAVIGHSVGEYVAACVAGVFTLEQGLQLIVERGRLMQARCSGGRMAALFTSVAEVAEAVAPMADRVAIAAINAPDSVVISGESEAVEELLERFAAREIRGQRLLVSVAAHSPMVESALDSMEACAARVSMSAPRIPVAWNLTGGKPLPSGAAPDAAYWRRHLREPVRFAEGMTELHAQGFSTFLEVGPHPALIALAQRSLPQQGMNFVSSLRRGKNDWAEMLAALAQLYIYGARIDWDEVNRPYGGRRCELPTYPFEHRAYWVPATATPSAGRPAPGAARNNRLKAERLDTAAPIFQMQLKPDAPSYLAQHLVAGAPLVPGPVFLELAQACASEAFGRTFSTIEDFTIVEPLLLTEGGRTVEIQLGTSDPHEFSVHSRAPNSDGPWIQHASGRFALESSLVPAAAGATTSLAALRAVLGERADCEARYALLASLGIEFTGPFRSLSEVYCAAGEALARVELAAPSRTDAVAWAHPALLDGAVQSIGFAVAPVADASDLYLLAGIEQIELRVPGPVTLWCHAKVRDPHSVRPLEWRADVTFYGIDGELIGFLRGARLRRASPQQRVRDSAVSRDGMYYQLTWEQAPIGLSAAPSLRSPCDFDRQLRDAYRGLAAEHGMQIYAELLPALDRLCTHHIVSALRQLGFDRRAGRIFEAHAEAARLGVLPRHHRLFARMLDMLVEDGLLSRRSSDQGASYEIGTIPETLEATPRYQALFDRFGAVDGELRTLQRCAEELAPVLQGRQDPLQLLFPGGSLTEARKLYVESPFARTFNETLARALAAAIEALPAGAPLRVLEIGAGTGGTTSYVLPLLQPHQAQYTFTDLSPLFLERAAEQFKQYAFVRYALLDIARDPSAQNFEPGQYDIVIAANVLHATADLRRSVEHARALLACGGLLLLMEGVAPERWADLTFGLTEGWWAFNDAPLRSTHPLIARDAWRELLSEVGFSEVAVIPDGTDLARGSRGLALFAARSPRQHRSWILVGDEKGWGSELATRLRARGDRVSLIGADQTDSELPADGELVYLGALELAARAMDDVAACDVSQTLACELPLRWLARVATHKSKLRAWLITHSAQHVAGQMSSSARWQSPLWGVGRVFALEHPVHWGGLLDLPPQASAAAFAETLFAAIESGGVEDQIAWRDDRRFVARLRHAAAPPARTLQLRADATYLITGGFGGLGLQVAQWLAANGARHIALLGRRPEPGVQIVRDIQAMGVSVIALAGDVADEATLCRQLARLSERSPPLRGIVHAAADMSEASIVALSHEQIRAMLRPKIEGTVVLERLTRSCELDFMVFFSTSTALLGAAGFAHYAAANTFLDATALACNRPGRRVLSVNWGTWDVMRLASAERQSSFRQAGLEPMSSEAALQALGALICSDDTAQAMVATINWDVLKPLHETRRLRPLLSGLTGESSATARFATENRRDQMPSALAGKLAAASETARYEILIDFVRREVAAVLDIEDAESVMLDAGLFEMGMDSLMSVELRKRLERGVGHKLPSTLTFNYPNVAVLASYLQRDAGDSQQPTPPDLRAAEPISVEVVTDDLDRLSEDQLEARLLTRLEAAQ
jgi:acyl transferase domain-containing protein/NAD(P)-dependent dehydrogenase (short-subunit alcohol dehydrogenase family)/acyl carrier protein